VFVEDGHHSPLPVRNSGPTFRGVLRYPQIIIGRLF
jgi:hypothetical protein